MTENIDGNINSEEEFDIFYAFDDYLNSITSGVKSKSVREEIKDEIIVHLEDNYERNIAVGMSHAAAIEDAIAKMGDKETLAFRLSSIHSYNPLKAMSTAVSTLMLSYALQNFIINLGEFKAVLNLIGVFVMLSALLRFRKVNKEFKISLGGLVVYCVGMLASCLAIIDNLPPIWVNTVISVINNCAMGICWLCVLRGLYKLCAPYITEETAKKPHLNFCAFYLSLIYFFAAFILILSEGETVNFQGGIILLAVIIFSFIFILIQLSRAKKILWDADGEYGIKPFDKSHALSVAGLTVAFIGIFIGYSYFSSVKEVPVTAFEIHDVGENSEKRETADKVRARLKELGMYEHHLADLPDSELLRYADAAYFSWSASGEGDSTFSKVTEYWFFYPNEDFGGALHEARVLKVLESDYSPHIDGFYRSGIYLSNWTANPGFNGNATEEHRDYIAIINDKNGKKYSSEPTFTYNLDSENIFTYPKGFEFKEEKGQRVYFAKSIVTPTPERYVYTLTTRVRKNSFITLGAYNTATVAKKVLGDGYAHRPSEIESCLGYSEATLWGESLYLTEDLKSVEGAAEGIIFKMWEE